MENKPAHEQLDILSLSAGDLVSSIAQAQYPSQLRTYRVGPQMARTAFAAAKRGESVDAVVDAAEAARDIRRSELTVSSDPEHEAEVPESPAAAEEPWSPHGVLDTMPQDDVVDIAKLRANDK